jgi:hypothetical protein
MRISVCRKCKRDIQEKTAGGGSEWKFWELINPKDGEYLYGCPPIGSAPRGGYHEPETELETYAKSV